MKSKVLSYYLVLKSSGELSQLFPDLKQEWEEDEIYFTQYYNENIKFIDDFEINLE